MAAQWLVDKSNVGWYSLDHSDNNLFLFLNYLIQAVNLATHHHCPNAKILAEKQQYASVEALLSELFSELASYPSHLYLVLDDYHVIEDNDIHKTINFFIRHLPESVTLVMISRSYPPVGIANLRIQERMLEIGHHLLAFDSD